MQILANEDDKYSDKISKGIEEVFYIELVAGGNMGLYINQSITKYMEKEYAINSYHRNCVQES